MSVSRKGAAKLVIKEPSVLRSKATLKPVGGEGQKPKLDGALPPMIFD